jgi:hypothetical protein
MPLRSTSWKSVLTLNYHLWLGLPSDFFPSSFTTKTLNIALFSTIRSTCPAHLIRLDFITQIILGEKYWSLSYSLKLLNVKFIFVIWKMRNIFDKFFRENSSATFRLVIPKFRKEFVGNELPFSRRVRTHSEKRLMPLLSFRVYQLCTHWRKFREIL